MKPRKDKDIEMYIKKIVVKHKEYIFKNKKELLTQVYKDGVSFGFLEFINKSKSLSEIFNKCNLHHRLWAIKNGYIQFKRNIDKLIINWNKINSYDWARTLISYPELYRYCNQWKHFTGHEWQLLLSKHPVFEKFCDWSKLDTYDWFMLLKTQPTFIYKKECNVNSFGSYLISALLSYQPGLYIYFDLNKIDGSGWSLLLHHQQDFAYMCDWGKLDVMDWYNLLIYRPEFATYLNDNTIINDEKINNLINKNYNINL